jgi:hypothetical protein
MDRRILVPAILAVSALAGCSSTGRSAVPAEGRDPVSMRDFFLYGCVREYTKAHSFPDFDSSVAYGVEYSRASDEVLSRVYAAAKAFAATLRAPDLSDPEHGGVAVVALCLEQSRDSTLASVVTERRQ